MILLQRDFIMMKDTFYEDIHTAGITKPIQI